MQLHLVKHLYNKNKHLVYFVGIPRFGKGDLKHFFHGNLFSFLRVKTLAGLFVAKYFPKGVWMTRGWGGGGGGGVKNYRIKDTPPIFVRMV